jgi:two-component system, NarL family, response regulator DevR
VALIATTGGVRKELCTVQCATARRTAARRAALVPVVSLTSMLIAATRHGGVSLVVHRRDVEKLTTQERRIIELVAAGMTNRQIGERVHLAEKTIKNYASNILMKLGLQSRAEVAALVVKRRRGGDAHAGPRSRRCW